MSSPVTLPISAEPLTDATLGAALRGVARRLTWKIAGAMLAIAVALQAWFTFETGFNTPLETHLSRATLNLLMACCIMFTTLVADEAVDRGAKRLHAYGLAVVIGSAIAALAQWQFYHWLEWHTHLDRPWNSQVQIAIVANVFLEYLLWGALIVLVYVNRRTALLASARMNVAQVERARAQSRVVTSRLQALQARVDPQFLFDSLVQVRQLYDTDPAKGGQMLDDLIVFLRAALPQAQDTSSTVARELTLATAYLSIRQAQHAEERLAFTVDAAPSVLGARMPPMMLLPSINHFLSDEIAASAGTIVHSIEIAVHARGGTLRLEVSHRTASPVAEDTGDILRDMRERLRLLYGERGMLRLESSSRYTTRIVLEIPHGATDGDHR
jgi:Histidine kinase